MIQLFGTLFQSLGAKVLTLKSVLLVPLVPHSLQVLHPLQALHSLRALHSQALFCQLSSTLLSAQAPRPDWLRIDCLRNWIRIRLTHRRDSWPTWQLLEDRLFSAADLRWPARPSMQCGNTANELWSIAVRIASGCHSSWPFNLLGSISIIWGLQCGVHMLEALDSSSTGIQCLRVTHVLAMSGNKCLTVFPCVENGSAVPVLLADGGSSVKSLY